MGFEARGRRMGELVDDAVGGDEGALNRLLSDVRPHVVALAQTRVSDRDDAEDVAQIVLLKLANGITGLRQSAHFWAWVRRIALNESASCHRRERASERLSKRFGREHGWDEEVDLDLSIDGRRLRDLVRSLGADLPPSQRRAVQRICIDGYRPCEVAKETGRAGATVRASLSRGRQEVLRRIVESHPGFLEELRSPAPIAAMDSRRDP